MLATALLALSVLGAPESSIVKTVPSVDLDRYVGRWYEIARYPNRFQRSCAGDVTATYERRKDGRIRVVNRCSTSDGGVKEAEGACATRS